MDEDIYFHKMINYRAFGHSLRFRSSQDLFSSHDIDTGTRFLLRSIVMAGLGKSERILDLGCGYGPLGICLKKLNSGSEVHLVDPFIDIPTSLVLDHQPIQQLASSHTLHIGESGLKDLVVVSGGPVALGLAQTQITVDAVAGEILRSIYRDQILTLVVTVALQLLRSLKPTEKLFVDPQKWLVGVSVHRIS